MIIQHFLASQTNIYQWLTGLSEYCTHFYLSDLSNFLLPQKFRECSEINFREESFL